MAKLEIIDLWASVEGKTILKGINVSFETGQTVALMGPNGNGKSTLLGVIMGNPKFKVEKGQILFNGKDIVEMEVSERAKLGIFIGMQYPVEVPGVLNADFLRTAMNSVLDKNISTLEFYKELEKNVKELKMSQDLAKRFLNQGFSGGEKKKNEILQMKMLKPKFALLDEIDSGLDVDALNIVAEEINNMKSNEFGTIIVSHYERLYSLVKPTHAHIIIDGKVVKSGGYELVEKIDTQGYDWLLDEIGHITIDNTDPLAGL